MSASESRPNPNLRAGKYYYRMLAASTIETEQWEKAEQLLPPKGWKPKSFAEAGYNFVRGYAAAMQGDGEAKKYIEKLAALREIGFLENHFNRSESLEVWELEIKVVMKLYQKDYKAAIQLAKRMGCRVFATVSSEKKANFCRDIGADETINYREENFSDRCMELTSGRGVEVIVELVACDNFDKDLDAICIDGRIIVIGTGTGKRPMAEYRVPAVMTKDARVLGLAVVNLIPKMGDLIRRFTPVLREGTLKVHIDQALPMESANKAHDIVLSGEFLGKVVLTP